MISLNDTFLLNLLLDVIPIFTDAARRQGKTHPDLKDFHFGFQIHLTLIKASLLVIDKEGKILDSDQAVLGGVADLLDYLVLDDRARTDKYSKLVMLQNSDPGTEIRFSKDKGYQEYLIRRLQECNHDLGKSKTRVNIQDIISEDADDNMPQELLQQANNIHKLLSKNWMCSCATTSRTVNLNLSSFRSYQLKDEFLRFDLLFSVSDAGSRWQEGEVLARPAKRKVDFKDGKTLEGKPRTTSQVTVCGGAPPTSTSTLCHLIKRASRNTARFSLEIDGEELMADTKLQPKQLHVNAGRGVPLSSLISDYISQMTNRELNELALILAYALLQLYDEDAEGPFCWLNPYWGNQHSSRITPQWTKYINFYYHGKVRPGKLDFQRPYLSSCINCNQEDAEPPIDNLEDVLHQAPSILALGKAVLEMQLLHQGLQIDFEKEDIDSDEEDGQNINSEYTQTAELIERYEKQLDHWYFEAINACLNPSPTKEMDIREYIYKKIVRPLEHNYHFNSATVEQVQKQLDELQKISEPNVAPKSPTADRDPRTGSVSPYSDNDQVPVKDEKERQSAQWFEWLGNVHTRVKEDARARKDNAEPEKVKIAILDTGVELSDLQRAIYDRRDDMKYKSWIGENEDGFEKGKDDVGHGTHITALLARVAPNAIIHVARVFKDGKPNMDTELKNVALAIRHAVDEWKVDIIVMSFGFAEEQNSENDEHSILKAIRYAYHVGITIFAAASNDGNNRPDHVCWPARALEVICVHSGTGTGQNSSFTPGPHDNQRIMVLGESIKPEWPDRLLQRPALKAKPNNNNPQQQQQQQQQPAIKLVKGTSYATTIAAGIAAIVLDYARRVLSQKEWERLRRVDCMKCMFERMRDDRIQNYWWIRPWDFFERRNSSAWIESEIRKVIS